MIVKDSAKGKPLEIKVAAQENGTIQLWINDELSYLTPNELVELHKMVVQAGRDLFSS